MRLNHLLRIAALGALVMPAGAATNFDGYTWAAGPIVMRIDAGNAVAATSPPEELRAAIESAMAEWNAALGVPLFQVTAGAGDAPRARNGRNEIHFASEIAPGVSFSGQFGAAVVRTTIWGRVLEADLVFNPAQAWTLYPGSLRFDDDGDRVAELRRVALHELGHVLGLEHPRTDDLLTIMRTRMSDVDGLQAVDRRDARRVARFLAEKNAPRLLTRKVRAAPSTRLPLRGRATPFFTRTIEVRVSFAGGTRRQLIPARASWRAVVRLGAGTNHVRLTARTPLSKQPVVFAQWRVRR